MTLIPIPPPPGSLVDVGGYRLHVEHAGDNGPAVMFDSGVGGAALFWAHTLPLVASSARCYAFDRAGYAWSDPAPAHIKRTTTQNVAEMRAALTELGVEPPYVLVGHSLGGVHMLTWAYQHREEVTGLVLVDSSHPQMFEWMPGMPSERTIRLSFGLIVGLGRLGLLRWLGWPLTQATIHNLDKLPTQTQTALKAFAQRPAPFEPPSREALDTPASFAAAQGGPGSLGDLPIVWLTADWWTTGKQMALKTAGMALREEAQTLSSHSRHVIVENCDHTDLPIVRPDVVAEAIREIGNR